jgi:hypothetical protein
MRIPGSGDRRVLLIHGLGSSKVGCCLAPWLAGGGGAFEAVEESSHSKDRDEACTSAIEGWLDDR